MFCPNCGTKVSDSSRFCQNCGAALNATPVIDNGATETVSQTSPTESINPVESVSPAEIITPVENITPVESVAPVEDVKPVESVSTPKPVQTSYSSSGYSSERPTVASYAAARSSKTSQSQTEASRTSYPATSSSVGIPWQVIIKICLLVGIVLFFCPFALVSCDGTTVVDGNGAEFAVGYLPDAEEYVDDVPVNPFLLVAFGAGIIGFLCSFASDTTGRLKVTAVFATIAIAGLLLFRVTFKGYYDLDDELTVEFLWGWIFSMIAFAVAFVGSIVQYKAEKEEYI
ncbi:MAG: zinc ribbon domain-containing protein [Oscillospiraceae bacterium]|nr:zinc ribbon domain-containing protein [Oscillospiraceae bacterium]